jgi:hypothetical protein
VLAKCYNYLCTDVVLFPEYTVRSCKQFVFLCVRGNTKSVVVGGGCEATEDVNVQSEAECVSRTNSWSAVCLEACIVPVYGASLPQPQDSREISGSHGSSVKMAVFWVVAPCSLVEVYRRFRATCCLLSLMMEAASTSETSVHFYQTTLRNSSEDSHLHKRISLFFTSGRT